MRIPSDKELKKNKIDVNDLLSMLREKGYFDIADVAYAVFEPSGELSVLPVGAQKPLAMEDLDKDKIKPAQLEDIVVVDGVLSWSGLNNAGKDEQWLFKRLGVTDGKDLKDILLCVYDAENDKLNTYRKSDMQ